MSECFIPLQVGLVFLHLCNESNASLDFGARRGLRVCWVGLEMTDVVWRVVLLSLTQSVIFEDKTGPTVTPLEHIEQLPLKI